MQANAKFRAVLFDLDGTLLDTLEDLADSTNAALRRFGYAPHPVNAYRNFVGDGVMNQVRRALPEQYRDEPTVSLVVAAEREEYSHRWANKTHPYDGVPELLNTLQDRGLIMCVLSNKPDHDVNMVVRRHLSRWNFATIRGEKSDIPRKPDPAGANNIALELGIPNSEFFYVGDTNTDMKTANAAGMFPVGALWGFRTSDELVAAGAKALIEHPLDLLHLLEP